MTIFTIPGTGGGGGPLVTGDLAEVLSIGNNTGGTPIDAAATLDLGTVSATTVNVGRTGQAVNVLGNLTISGTTTIISATNLAISDQLIILADGAASGVFGGVALERGSTGDDALILWNETSDRFELGVFDTTGGTTVPGGALTTTVGLRSGNIIIGGGGNTVLGEDNGLVLRATVGNITIDAQAAASITFTTSATARWQFNASGNLVTFTDNALDIGASGATRPRTVYVGTSLNVGDGITPSADNGDFVFGDVTGSLTYDHSTTKLWMRKDSSVAPSYEASVPASSNLIYTAFDGAQGNWHNELFNDGVTVQPHLVFSKGRGTLAAPTNSVDGDQVGRIVWGGVMGGFHSSCAAIIGSLDGTQTASSSSPGRLGFYTTNLNVWASPSLKWQIDNQGHFCAGTDNSRDIGAEDNGTTLLRPRNIYVATQIFLGTTASPTAQTNLIDIRGSAANTAQLVRIENVNPSSFGSAGFGAVSTSNISITMRAHGPASATNPSQVELASGSGTSEVRFQATSATTTWTWRQAATLWTINGGNPPTTGHFVPGTNNVHDIGTNSVGVRTIYISTSLRSLDANGAVNAAGLLIQAGQGAAGGGDPGDLSMAAGNAGGGTTDVGGIVTITAGNGGSGGAAGGEAAMFGGNGGTTSAGGVSRIQGGSGGATNGVGGDAQVIGGGGNGTAAGGIALLRGGLGGTTSGAGGEATVQGGQASNGTGGAVSVVGGSSSGSNGAGGAASLLAGGGNGSGAGGAVTINSGSPGVTGNSGTIAISTPAGGGTSGNSGSITINVGSVTSGTVGTISIGTTVACDISIANASGQVGFFGATPVGQSSAYTPTNVTTDRAYDANSTTLDEVADVLGTLIADLQAIGILG